MTARFITIVATLALITACTPPVGQRERIARCQHTVGTIEEHRCFER